VQTKLFYTEPEISLFPESLLRLAALLDLPVGILGQSFSKNASETSKNNLPLALSIVQAARLSIDQFNVTLGRTFNGRL